MTDDGEMPSAFVVGTRDDDLGDRAQGGQPLTPRQCVDGPGEPVVGHFIVEPIDR